jgi:DNA-binding MarR family transcriptional regulator
MLRMRELAERALVSKSRLTHTVDRLAARGLVRREPCPEDRRGVSAVLTANGLTLLQQAAPTHVDGVRRLLLSRVPQTGVRHLVQTLRPVALRLGESTTATGGRIGACRTGDESDNSTGTCPNRSGAAH